MIEQKIVDLMSSAQHTISKLAPQAFELALRQMMWEGIGAIAGGLVALIIALLLLRFCFVFWHRLEDDPAAQPMVVLPGIATGVAFVAALALLLDIWNWVALFDPKVALFHKLFEKVVG